MQIFLQQQWEVIIDAIKTGINHLLLKFPIVNELNLGSKGLNETLVTLQEGKDTLLRETVQWMRDSFESHELDTIRWITASENVSDALKKE